MALRDQPYLPLYVQDFMTDEKLIECSAEANGVYIRIMCLLHKSEPYGKLLLRQKDRQHEQQILNFADKLAVHLPFTVPVILSGLSELLEAGCLRIDGDFLFQKRMVEDNELSIKRSNSGRKGAETTNNRNKELAAAKQPANTEYEIEYNSILKELESNKLLNGENEEEKKAICMVVVEMEKIWLEKRPTYTRIQKVDYPALLKIAYAIADLRNWTRYSVTADREYSILQEWKKISTFLLSGGLTRFFREMTLDSISLDKNLQKILEAMNQQKSGPQSGMVL